MSKKKENNVSNGLLSGLLQVPVYPMSFVKVLIQIGHEPLPPFRSKNIFGREQYYYPNSFSYLRYIYSVEGLTGLYRGVGMKIISHSIGTIVYNQVSNMIEESDSANDAEKPENTLNLFIKQTTGEITARCLGVVLSHPFHVMALKCMAQFVGGETRYSSWNVFRNSIEIYQTEGILGFFSGLVPRLLFEASSIALTNGIAYLIKTYLFEEKDIDGLIDLFSSLLANSVTYPLSLVSTVSCITGSHLVAGSPPRMLVYASWIDVFKHLYETNELKRGSSSFFRLYSAPIITGPTAGFKLNNLANKKLKQAAA